MKMNDMFAEDMSGHIVGRYMLTGRLYFDGRPQSQSWFAETEAELQARALERMAELRRQCGEAFREIFPARGEWRLRIYA